MPASANLARRGRPPKQDGERRRHSIDVVLTQAERDQFDALAVGDTSSIDILRELILDEDALPSPEPCRHEKRQQISLTFAEKEHLTDLAKKKGLSLSDYVRQAVRHRLGSDHRGDELRIKIDPKSLEHLTDQAGQEGLTVADYLLTRAEGGTSAKPSCKSTASILLELSQAKVALDRIGNNVNQIARASNAGKFMPGMSAATAKELAAERKKVMKLIDEVAVHYAS